MTHRVFMVPNPSVWKSTHESGIKRVVEAYIRYLPAFGWQVVEHPDAEMDIVAIHAGLAQRERIHVCHSHGLYWTADYDAANWEWGSNQRVIETSFMARKVTVPSEWVAETYRRDLRINPTVIGHGMNMDEWGEPAKPEGYILWNKNRAADVCDPAPVGVLAARFPNERFVSTFLPPGEHSNIREVGVIPWDEMREMVKRASVYLATTKETFGIGTLEAMASGVPVLGYAHGGILDMVQHGVNGYLARPWDKEDLAEGLDYCLRNAAILGANGREIAKQFTWEQQIAKVAAVYEEALYDPPPTAAIIIPAYNYASVIGRAIESALRQDYPLLKQVIVVDDGSPDDGNTRDVVREWQKKDVRLGYIRQENQGVAIARNTGIEVAWQAGVKYVACLDADDWLDPRFLSYCIEPLEQRPEVGIAYTGLYFHRPDGKEGLSSWPQEWDFDAQLMRRNQVPTACVFRTEMWRRLGGYRQRYAPNGAGSEDAEFWLRSGAYGYKALKVCSDGLFHYSWLTGNVTGKPGYVETDWLGWHPWAGEHGDGRHPMASRATAPRFSHAVRQYDEPLVSVIIPCGPGHQKHLWDALDSLEAQSFRRWEAIVVIDSDEPLDERIKDAYPYVRWVLPGKNGGAGKARNLGADIARAPFLLFLDADDYLRMRALDTMLEAWRLDNAIIYSDYRGRAFVEDRTKLAPDLQARIYDYNERTHEALIGYVAWDFDCERALRQPEDGQPYLWCNVTCLIPKAWHKAIGGFDEAMPSWEDIDYHYRMVRAGHCYVRVAEELLVYRFYTGTRRDAGLQGHRSIVEYMRKKYAKEQPVGCGCRGNGKSAVGMGEQGVMIGTAQDWSASMNDSDFVLAKYNHPNVGMHSVVGGSTRTNYGYRSGGEVFLVHRLDVQGQPHLFSVVDEKPTPVPEEAPVALPEPVALASEPAKPKRAKARRA